MAIKSLLEMMAQKGASDLHIRSGGRAILRVDGKLLPLETIYTAEESMGIANSLMNDEQKAVFHVHHEVDLAYTYSGLGRYRVNIFQQRGSVNIVFRTIPIKIPTIKELKLPQVISTISENQRGLVLVAGTTGSGKSTTLASMIDYINTTRSGHIVTIEDPIEFMHIDKQSIVSQRELGFDTLTYIDALRNVVRQDPNVILLGEMRDTETVAASITAAQTGHLVLSTIHTVDSAQTINRILDMFPIHQQNQIRFMLADTLKAVISQRLLPHSSGTGRVPAVEVMIVTNLIKKLIEENNISEITNVMKQGQYYGMQTFNQVLVDLYKKEEVKLEDALNAASNPEELMMIIRGVHSGADSSDIFE